MRTLSNNRNNAIGPWYVYSNNGPSNANANNWGGRTPTQGGTNTYIFLYPKVLRMILNQSPGMAKLSKTDSTWMDGALCASPFLHPVRGGARVGSQSPIKKRGLVGGLPPLEETRAERDALQNNFMERMAA